MQNGTIRHMIGRHDDDNDDNDYDYDDNIYTRDCTYTHNLGPIMWNAPMMLQIVELNKSENDQNGCTISFVR